MKVCYRSWLDNVAVCDNYDNCLAAYIGFALDTKSNVCGANAAPLGN